MATKTWTQAAGIWFSNVWVINTSSLQPPPVSGDTAIVEGAVTITAAEAKVTGQGTLDGITIEFERPAGHAVPTLDISDVQFGTGVLIDTPTFLDAARLVARGTVAFAGQLRSNTTLTLDIEAAASPDTSGLARFTNTGTVTANNAGNLAVVGASGATFVNDGLLLADISADLAVQTALTNGATGTLAATNRATLALHPAGGLLGNAGLVYASAPPGSTNYTAGVITVTGALANTGTVAIAPFGTMTVSGSLDNAAEVAVQDATLGIGGNLTNEAGATFDITLFGTATIAGNATNDGALAASALVAGAYSPGTLAVAGAFANTGSLDVPYGGVLNVGGGLTNSGTFTFGGSGSLDGLASNAGVLALQGGTLTESGTLANLAGGQLSLTGFALLAGSGALSNQGTLIVSQLSGTLYTPGTIDISGALSNSGLITVVYFGTVTSTGGAANSGTINVAGGTLTLGGPVTNTRSIVATAGQIAFTGTVDNEGVITENEPAGAWLGGTLGFGGALQNSGTIADVGGTVTVAGSLSGTGTIEVGDNVVLDGKVSGQTLDFGTNTDGTITLGDIGAFSGTIANLTGHDIIDVNGVATGTTYNSATHMLTVLDGSNAVATFALSGSSVTTLNVGSDGHGGSILSTEQIGTPAQVETYIVQNDFDTIFTTGITTPETHGWVGTDPTIYYAFENGNTYTAADRSAFAQAMAFYSAVADITFATADATHPADLFITTNGGGSAETTYGVTQDNGVDVVDPAVGVTISIDTLIPGWQDLGDFGTADTTGEGNYGYTTILHELGHTIGFGHPGPYDDGQEAANFLSDQIFYTDTRQYTVMSYNDSSQSGADWYYDGTDMIYPQTAMMYDIGAAQMIYGANTTELGGGQSFGFNSSFAATSPLSVYNFAVNSVPVVTIFDAGKNNTLDLSGWSTPSNINLNAGSFSSADTMLDNIAIAGNTTIDSAVGGGGNDIFTLNADADTVNGGGGSNTAVLAGPSADYVVGGHAGTVTVTDTLTDVADTLSNIQFLQFAGGFVQAAPCFLRGTLILTARGDVPVQALVPGEDRVVTRGGRLAPVRWIGWRDLDPARHPRPADVLPVRVRAGALGPGRPRRDLLLSADHALAFADMLIPVRYLINGATVVQEPWRGRIAYYHVELDRHDVLLAEGAAAESYLDTGNRRAFANLPGAIELHPHFAPHRDEALRIWADRGCARLVADGPALAQIRAMLAERAASLGHVATDDPALRATVAGRPVALAAAGDRLVAALPPRSTELLLLSRVWTPLDEGAAGADSRRLGVAVAALWLDGAPVALDDARLGAGWHARERGLRWTDGAAALRVGKARQLALRLGATGRYWIAPAEAAQRAGSLVTPTWSVPSGRFDLI